MIDHPSVSPWMLHDGESVRASALRLRQIASTVGGTEITVRDTLGAAATTLGWRGQITDRAAESSETTRTMLTRLADGCEAAGIALLELASTMAWHGPRLVQLLQTGVVDPLPRIGLPVDPPVVLPSLPEGMEHTLPVGGESRELAGLRPVVGSGSIDGLEHTLPIERDPVDGGFRQVGLDPDREVLQHVEALELADKHCHDRLVAVREDLMGMAPRGTDPDFLRSLLPREAWIHLMRAGLVPLRPKDRGFEHTPGFPVNGRGPVTIPVPPGLRTQPGEHVTPDGPVLTRPTPKGYESTQPVIDTV